MKGVFLELFWLAIKVPCRASLWAQLLTQQTLTGILG